MDKQQRRRSPGRLIVASAITVGVAAGSYGVMRRPRPRLG